MVKYGYRGNNFMKLLCGNFAVRIQNDKIFMFYELSCVICNLINGVLYFKRKNNMDQCTIAFTVLRFTVTVFLYQKGMYLGIQFDRQLFHFPVWHCNF